MEKMPLEPHKHHHHHHHPKYQHYEGQFRHPHPYHNPNSTAWNGHHNWIDWLGDRRHYRPWYDSNADYNTNAKSYYDYLGYRIRLFDTVIDQVNETLRRDLEVLDTKTVDLTRYGDWQKRDDIIQFQADVRVAEDALNDIEVRDGGLWSEDFQPKIDALQSQIDELRNRIEDLEAIVYDQGEFKRVPSEYVNITHFNGCEPTPDPARGETAVYVREQNNIISIKIRFYWRNEHVEKLKLSGFNTQPWKNVPESMLVGVTLSGPYAYLNGLFDGFDGGVSNGALQIVPTSARANWQPSYQVLDDGDGLSRPKWLLCIANVADGYNTRTTFADNYDGQQLNEDYGVVINYGISYHKPNGVVKDTYE